MKVILDTNVLLSALISPYGAPDIIYRNWRKAHFELITSQAQLEELRRVTRYPKLKAILPPHRIGAMMNHLQRAIILQDLPKLPADLTINDPDDAFLVTMALAADVDYLVTGDQRAGLLALGSAGRARIVTPHTFCNQFL